MYARCLIFKNIIIYFLGVPENSYIHGGLKTYINPVVEVEQSSYEDDLQILRVIEAYCTSKQRQTITNSGIVIQVIINSKTNNP